MASLLERYQQLSRDEARMSIVEHLGELRSRIIKVAVAFIAVSVVAFIFVERIYYWLLAPAPPSLREEGLNFMGVTSPFITDIKISLYAGLMITLPILIYQTWMFVVPAVGDMGRVFTYTLVGMTSALFLGGAVFSYYLVVPTAMDFLIGWGGDRYNDVITSEYYLSFITRVLLGFGVAFELPAATYVGAKLGLITDSSMRKYRKHAVVVNAVLAAMLTPPDVFSMFLMLIPLTFLYEVSILIARMVNPAKAYEPSET